MNRDAHALRSLATFTAGYAVAVALSEHVYGSRLIPSPFWLPDAVLLSAFLLAPRDRWWMFLAVVWPIRLILGAAPDTPFWFQVLTVAIDMAKAVAAAWLLQRILRRPVRLITLHEFLIFFIVAAVGVPAVSMLFAAPARHALGDSLGDAATRWFLGDALAQVVVTPAILYWSAKAYRDRDARIPELIVVCGLLATTLLYLFVVERPFSMRLAYLPMPFLIWAAVRLRPFGTANAIALVAFVAILGAANGSGVFGGRSAAGAVLSIQIVLLLLSTSLLPLAILTAEHATLRERETELTRRLLNERERERARIARELHDDLAQRMAALKIGIDRLGGQDTLSDANRERLGSMSELAADICSSLQNVSHTLHPVTLEIVGIERSIKRLCTDFSHQHGIEVAFTAKDIPGGVSGDVSLCLFRVVQEALRNVATHSGATVAHVELTWADDCLSLRIWDNGAGFDPDRAQIGGGLGLASMRERIGALGGHLIIQSEPAHGATVSAHVPAIFCHSSATT